MDTKSWRLTPQIMRKAAERYNLSTNRDGVAHRVLAVTAGSTVTAVP